MQNKWKAATALGWYGKKDMLEYWNQLSNEFNGLSVDGPQTANSAMLWGFLNEESALVTYLQNMTRNKMNVSVRETGVWFLRDKEATDWLASSPDGLIQENNENVAVLEIKCPFIGWKTSAIQKCRCQPHSSNNVGNAVHINKCVSLCCLDSCGHKNISC